MTTEGHSTRTDDRRVRVAGVLFLITFVSAITGAVLYQPALADPASVPTGGTDVRIMVGAVCELVLIVANIGTAVALFPVLRHRTEVAALGFVTARVMECVFIAVGVLAVLTLVSLRAHGDAASFALVAPALVALHEWTFLLGPGFVVGIGNGLLLGFALYRSGLVPRPMALFGIIGGPLMSLSGIAVLFGAYGQSSAISGVLTLPEIVWEAFLGLYLTIIGFRRPAAQIGIAREQPVLASPESEGGTQIRA
jgi:hypothetical protein